MKPNYTKKDIIKEIIESALGHSIEEVVQLKAEYIKGEGWVLNTIYITETEDESVVKMIQCDAELFSWEILDAIQKIFEE